MLQYLKNPAVDRDLFSLYSLTSFSLKNLDIKHDDLIVIFRCGNDTFYFPVYLSQFPIYPLWDIIAWIKKK